MLDYKKFLRNQEKMQSKKSIPGGKGYSVFLDYERFRGGGMEVVVSYFQKLKRTGILSKISFS